MFQKASKKNRKLRMALMGPSGSGKTMSALRVGTGLAAGGRIALIDTENRSSEIYADRWDFDVCNLEGSADIDSIVEALTFAANEQYAVVIVDSLSHAWQELLQEVDRLARAKFQGNTWGAWSEGTPKQKRLIKALLTFPGHVIATMRSKTEWSITKGKNGKDQPIKIGLAPEQGKGIEYEFDFLVEISFEHFANVTKDRSGKYQDEIIEKPSEKWGIELLDWLNSGAADPSGDAINTELYGDDIAKMGDRDCQDSFTAFLKEHPELQPEYVEPFRAAVKARNRTKLNDLFREARAKLTDIEARRQAQEFSDVDDFDEVRQESEARAATVDEQAEEPATEAQEFEDDIPYDDTEEEAPSMADQVKRMADARRSAEASSGSAISVGVPDSEAMELF